MPSPSSGKSVLVVDDNALARSTLVKILESADFEVHDAPDAYVALYLLASGPPPNVILLDIMMPGMDGERFLDWRKGMPFGSVPVIVTTGGPMTREEATAQGCAGFLKKPFDRTELLAELSRVVGTPNPVAH